MNTLAADGQSGLSELESDLVTAITDTDTTELVDSATDTGRHRRIFLRPAAE